MDVHKLTKVEWAYLAGLFDGEGYIRYKFGPISKRRRESAENYMTISNNYKPVLVRLKSKLGEGFIVKSKPKNPKHKMRWFLKFSSRPTFRLLSHLAPYLQIKLEAADLLLQNKALITKKGPRKESEKVILRRLSEQIGELTNRGASDELIRAQDLLAKKRRRRELREQPSLSPSLNPREPRLQA
jgi:intein/homing endonuclease